MIDSRRADCCSRWQDHLVKRDVSAQLEVQINEPTTLEMQIGVALHPGADVSESLVLELDGKTIAPQEIIGAHGTRIHRFVAGTGNLRVNYSATVLGTADPVPTSDYDLAVYLRPSRYAESDKFFGFATTEFGSIEPHGELLAAVSSWVGRRMKYVPGSSDPIDGAADTLLAGAGVCRDYAHLVVAMLRAVKVPARLVSVYAPGCVPMDFHAVAEAYIDGVWRVVDATCLAPRSTLVRIATGRDAADTAFLDNHGGDVTLNNMWVSATVDGLLPSDDIAEPISIW